MDILLSVSDLRTMVVRYMSRFTDEMPINWDASTITVRRYPLEDVTERLDQITCITLHVDDAHLE